MNAPHFFGGTPSRTALGIIFFTSVVLVPCMVYSGFAGGTHMDELTLHMLSGIGGFVALCIVNHKRMIANLLSGPLMGLGVSFTTAWYLSGRHSILKIEILIPFILGLLPGLLLYYILSRMTAKG